MEKTHEKNNEQNVGFAVHEHKCCMCCMSVIPTSLNKDSLPGCAELRYGPQQVLTGFLHSSSGGLEPEPSHVACHSSHFRLPATGDIQIAAPPHETEPIHSLKLRPVINRAISNGFAPRLTSS